MEPMDTVASVDGEVFTLDKARRQATRMFYGGFFGLPLLWLVNVWLFWPDFTSGRDPVLKKRTRQSAVTLTIFLLLFIPWFLFYIIAGEKYLSSTAYKRLDVTRLPVSDYIGI